VENFKKKFKKGGPARGGGGGGLLQLPTQTSLHLWSYIPFKNPGYAAGASYEYEKKQTSSLRCMGPLKTGTA